MSEVLAVTANVSCITISISVPKNFSVQVVLFSLSTQKTVYEAVTATSRNIALDLFAKFEVPLTADHGEQMQLVIFVSMNVTINAVTISFDHCLNNSLYLLPVLA